MSSRHPSQEPEPPSSTLKRLISRWTNIPFLEIPSYIKPGAQISQLEPQVWAQGFQWEKGEIGTPGSEWLGAPSAGFQVPWVFFTSQGRREQPTDGWMCAASAATVCSVFLPSAMTSSCGEDEIVVMSATNEIPLFLRERVRSSVNLSPHLAGCRPSWG